MVEGEALIRRESLEAGGMMSVASEQPRQHGQPVVARGSAHSGQGLVSLRGCRRDERHKERVAAAESLAMAPIFSAATLPESCEAAHWPNPVSFAPQSVFFSEALSRR